MIRRVRTAFVVLFLLQAVPVLAQCVVDGGGPVVTNSVVTCVGSDPVGIDSPSAEQVSISLLPGASVANGLNVASGIIEIGSFATVAGDIRLALNNPLNTSFIRNFGNVAGLIHCSAGTSSLQNFGTVGGRVLACNVYNGAGSSFGGGQIHNLFNEGAAGPVSILYGPGRVQGIFEPTAPLTGPDADVVIHNTATGTINGGIEAKMATCSLASCTWHVVVHYIDNHGVWNAGSDGKAWRMGDAYWAFVIRNHSTGVINADIPLDIPGRFERSFVNEGTINGNVVMNEVFGAGRGRLGTFTNAGRVNGELRVADGLANNLATASFGPTTVLRAYTGPAGSGGTIRTQGDQRVACIEDMTLAPTAPPPVSVDGGVIHIADGTLRVNPGSGRTCSARASVDGPGALVKEGAGTQVLNGSVEAGTVTVSAGTLLVNGAVNGATTVQPGGTLGGQGALAAVTVQGAGVLSPGLSIGTLATGNLTLAAGAMLHVEVDAASADRVDAAGAVSLGGAVLDLVLDPAYVHMPGRAITVISNDGSDAVTGAFAGLAEGALFAVAGRYFRISYAGGDGNDVVVTSSAAPSSVTLAGSPNPSLFGQSVTLTATVTGTSPTGTVTFVEGAASLGSAALSGGSASFATAGLAVGSHTLTAQYAGDSVNLGSSSPPYVQVVLPTTPGAPRNVIVSPGDGALSIVFSAPVSDGGATILDYTATCGAASATAAASPVVVAGLANGVAYVCTVTARNSAGTGPASSPANGTPIAVPGSPTAVTAAPGNGRITVSFAAPASSGGSPILDYTASCGTVSATGNGPPIVVSGLVNGTAYTCTVAARNAAGSGPASSPSASVVPATVPGAPQGVAIVAGNAELRVSFTAPASDGGSVIVDYTATCGARSATGGASPLLVTGLENGTTYSCSVVARNAMGTGPASNAASGTPAAVPGPPTGVVATAGNAQISVAFAGPANAGGSPILDYTATCGTRSATAAASPIVVTGLANGTSYTCTVTARNAVGSSAPSAPSDAVMPSAGRTFSSGSPTGSGPITATFSGGGPACSFVVQRFIAVEGDAGSPPAGSAPAGVYFPHGLFDFTTSACAPGATITVSITYPAPLPPGTRYWKYGPTPARPTPSWYVMPANISGSTVTLEIVDGGLGDDDLSANGTIVDQGGPGISVSAEAIPTLSEWMLALLALLMLFAAGGVRVFEVTKRAPRRPS